MKLFRQLTDAHATPRAIAIGNFDGLHVGHAAVIDAMCRAAQSHDLIPSVLTFEPHPRLFFAPSTPVFRLETLATKLRRLRDAGVAQVVMPHFDASFANLTAEAFLNDILRNTLRVRAVAVGDNFAFGKNRGGDVTMLKQWGATEGVDITVVPPVMVAGAACSSTAIREKIAAGDMAGAATLLGRNYMLGGRVMHGDGRGRTIGFPTANVSLPQNVKLPAYGVYAVRATVHGTTHDAVANFGVRPTIEHTSRASLEVHVFDFDQSIYGARMEVQFIAKVRDEKKFDSLAALTNQIEEDCISAKSLLSGGLTPTPPPLCGSPWKATQ